MFTGHDIICISSIDWDFNWQGHQEIMSTLARQGNRVLFIENTGVRRPTVRDLPRLWRRLMNWLRSTRGFRQAQERIWIYSPLILPFPYARIARVINRWLLLKAIRRWMRVMSFHDPIIWTFLPTGTALDVLSHLDHKLAVYYCIADFEVLADNPSHVQKTEEKVLKRCNLVFAQGEVIADKCRRWNSWVHIFPFGVQLEAFERSAARGGNGIPEDMKHIARPIIGYLGGVHRHIDFQLVRDLADRRPNWSVVLVGPEQANTGLLKKAGNIFLLGQKVFDDVPKYIEQFDVCIIPYVLSDYTKTVYPTKLNEYHALGKPVVSTALPELVALNKRYGNLIRLAHDSSQFIQQVEEALGLEDEQLIRRRRVAAQENTWAMRIQQMSVLMEQRMASKALTSSADWQRRVVAVYRRIRQRLIGAVAMLVVVYVAAFYSPLIWWVASPLKIAQPVRTADAIVVFAGGVGESGQAGQGYTERVERAVELYRQGYAVRLIFSSGFIYSLNETDVMKALAVSMGVPPGAIHIEPHARNTYQNVQFTGEMVLAAGGRSLLLVSSPYHMRRCMLVFRRQLPALTVIPAPIERSVFFSHGAAVEWRQWRAILHEYAGILNYWLRGYL